MVKAFTECQLLVGYDLMKEEGLLDSLKRGMWLYDTLPTHCLSRDLCFCSARATSDAQCFGIGFNLKGKANGEMGVSEGTLPLGGRAADPCLS